MASFFIRSSTLRLTIFISTLLIAVILVFQLVWMRKVYRLEQKEFDHNVTKAIRGLYEDLDDKGWYSSHINELVENPEPQLYIARISLPIDPDSLLSYLHYELEDFDIFTDCHVGIYSDSAGEYIFTGVVNVAVNKVSNLSSLPVFSKAGDHLALYFPRRKQYILSRMNVWIVSSGILLLVLILFGASLYYFYRQRSLNEVQKDFLHHFTHEFKTPVSVISLAAEVLEDPAIKDRPDKLATYAGIVGYQANYLKTQIEKLLKFAAVESRKLQLITGNVNLHDLIHQSMLHLGPLIDEKKAAIELQLCASDPCLVADKDYLLIVITNLIDNAIKYSRNPQLFIVTSNNMGKIMLAVTDNGIGIEKKNLKKLFRKFSRFNRDETQAARGFGLGLTFVKMIVSAHGGKVIVGSVPGTGSTFAIELPQ